jgi:hypothetical protein
MSLEIGVLVGLGVLAVAVMALALRQPSAPMETGFAEDEVDEWVPLAPSTEPSASVAATAIASAQPVPSATREPVATPEPSAIPIVPEPDATLTALAALSASEALTEKARSSEPEAAPADAIQLGPPIVRPVVAAPTVASVATNRIPSSRGDKVRLTSQNRREPVIAPAGTHLVTDSGAMIKTLEWATVPCATDAGPGWVDVSIQVVGSRPMGFKSGSAVDVAQIDLVTAIVSSVPPAIARPSRGVPPPESSPEPPWMQNGSGPRGAA